MAFIATEAFQHPAHPDLSDQARISEVIQESDFPWEITIGLFDAQKILALCASGARRGKPISRRSKIT